MNPLTTMEIKLCQAQAKIFENSVSKTNYSSLIFIRRFMYSTIAKSMDKRVYLYQSDSITDALNTINEEFGESSYGKIKYSEDQMYWIGYIYRCISIKYNLSSKNASVSLPATQKPSDKSIGNLVFPSQKRYP